MGQTLADSLAEKASDKYKKQAAVYKAVESLLAKFKANKVTADDFNELEASLKTLSERHGASSIIGDKYKLTGKVD